MGETIADRLKMLRSKHGHSQDTLAVAARVSVVVINSIEQGSRTDPVFSIMLNLAHVLGGTLAAFDGVSVPVDTPLLVPDSVNNPMFRPDPSDDALADRLRLTGLQREAFIQRRRELLAELARQAEQDKPADQVESEKSAKGKKGTRRRKSN